MADVGQEEVGVAYLVSSHLSYFNRGMFCQDFEAARKKALAVGAKKFFLEVNLSAEYVLTRDHLPLHRISSENS